MGNRSDDGWVSPHGGRLKELIAPDRVAELRAEALRLPTWDLTPRQTLDLELLLNGAFSPLEGYLGARDHASVCREMRLADGTLWPMPLSLDVPTEVASRLGPGDRLALRHAEGMPLAILQVADRWAPDLSAEAVAVFGSVDPSHPGVHALLHETHPVYLGGRVEGIELPPHPTFRGWRASPAELRSRFRRLGWRRVVGFQTRNPLHRAHVELTRRAAERADAKILLHPVVGRTKPGDLDEYLRVRCYQEVLPRYAPGTVELALLPLAMRMAGPREAVWHAILRQNFGCSHFIVGRDHAGPGNDSHGRPFYEPYEAQRLVAKLADELEIEILPYEELVYVEALDAYHEASRVPPGARASSLSGTRQRELLRAGSDLPAWFTFPEVVAHLRRMYPPRAAQGFTVFLTGLSGAGKSTIANILVAKLLERGDRPVTLLDGDLVRKVLSSELGFSREHRDTNVRRIGFVAAEVTRNRGVAVCAPIAPYDAARKEARAMVEPHGGFVLVHVSTPIEVCEARDRKGLYAKARAGALPRFTGISDPYEPPADAEIVIDASRVAAEAAAEEILEHLRLSGYVG